MRPVHHLERSGGGGGGGGGTTFSRGGRISYEMYVLLAMLRIKLK